MKKLLLVTGAALPVLVAAPVQAQKGGEKIAGSYICVFKDNEVSRGNVQAEARRAAQAEQAQLNTTHIYRTLSAKGNPELRSLSAILKTMGLRLAVQPIHSPTAHA